jgi:hypothetical protein
MKVAASAVHVPSAPATVPSPGVPRALLFEPIRPNVRTISPAERSVTERDRAVAAMTPQTRAMLPDALLDARVGRGTLAGELNDQIRFRVEQRGASVDQWQLLPDSPLAAAIVQTDAGAHLLGQLRTSMSTIGVHHDRSNLKGFILPDDLEGVIAARAVAFLEDPAEPQGHALARFGAARDARGASELLQSWREPMRQRAERAGAWNGEGWITFLPHTSRAMLVAAGAYAPHRSYEPYLLDAQARVEFLSGNGAHEVQHSVTDRTPAASYTWMEEGIANVFSRTPRVQERLASEAGLSVESYRANLRREPGFQTGWAPYARSGSATRAERGQQRERMYDRSQDVLRDLARMAGADTSTDAGLARAYELMQSRTLYFVPGMLADAIIAHNGLDSGVRDRLRDQIKRAIDLPNGAKDIATEFGIAS